MTDILASNDLENPLEVAPSHLSADQQAALSLLQNSKANMFLTGSAGSGKSYVVREWMSSLDRDSVPVLASTGAAAVLVGGRTFHSFFGLGLMEGGMDATVERALRAGRLRKRLRETKGILIDEISMIPGQALMAAEMIARLSREKEMPWGGLRVVAVGDFSQLPPVTRAGEKRDWCFRTEIWNHSEFKTQMLQVNHRVSDGLFLKVLEKVRLGQIDSTVRDYLNERAAQLRNPEHKELARKAPRLYSRRDQVDQYNQLELDRLPGAVKTYESIAFAVSGNDRALESLRKNSPIRDRLDLKKGARVLFVQNDPQKRWINGTQGTIFEMTNEHIVVEKNNGRTVKVERASFSSLDADGEVLATIMNFPIVLAYAVTIHKSQGMTLDSVYTDLRRLWEPGQAYVALSRLRHSSGLFLESWAPQSILVDPEVLHFYKQIHEYN